MDHSELIKSEASKLAELHFCPEIKANLASKEANIGSGALYGGLGGAGLGAMAGGIHGLVKRKGSLKDALKQSLLGALLGGGVGAGAGAGYGAMSGKLQELGEAAKEQISGAAKGKGPEAAANTGTEAAKAVSDTPILDKVKSQVIKGGLGGATTGGALGYALDQNRASVSSTGAKELQKMRVAQGKDTPGRIKSMLGRAKANVRGNVDAALDKLPGSLRLGPPKQPNRALELSKAKDQLATMLDKNVSKSVLMSGSTDFKRPVTGQEIASYLDNPGAMDKNVRRAVKEVLPNVLDDSRVRIRPQAMIQDNLGIVGRAKDMAGSKGLSRGVRYGGGLGIALPILNQVAQDYYKAK